MSREEGLKVAKWKITCLNYMSSSEQKAMQHILEKYGHSPVEDATTTNDMLMRSIVIHKKLYSFQRTVFPFLMVHKKDLKLPKKNITCLKYMWSSVG